MKRVGLIALLAGISLSVCAFPEASSGGTFTAFGPKDYIRATGQPTTTTNTFSVLDPKTVYTLHIYNAGKNNHLKGRVSSAIIRLNGVQVIGPNDLSQTVSHIGKPITLSKNNKLAVELRSKPQSGITIEIIGVDNTPPAIKATLTPPPNAGGWNNTDVTVSFVCSDTTSGVASCPAPVRVGNEGANRVVSGTATDVAGNSASISVAVNLDKTPPVVAITSPLPGSTVEDSPAVVQGTFNEALSGIAAITCNGTTATLSNASFTCNVSLVIGQNSVATVARDLAGNIGHAGILVSYLGPKYLAIVDVMVTDSETFANVPGDYTGLAWGGTCTSPYVPGIIGTRVWANDVNVGIGGTYTTVWVKYDFVPVASDRPVLVDYGAFHWPYWDWWCPSGWQRANGTSSGIQGALTTGTEGDCFRNGLCVHYLPMKQANAFITNAGLSYTGGPEAACPVLGGANLGYWPMQADSYDIHKNCADDRWIYLCYGRGKAWPPMPKSIDVTDEEKLNLLATFAPRVWLAQNEAYWPSSVEWAFPNLRRFIPCAENPLLCGGGAEYASYYWLQTRETLDSPSDVLDYFRGCNGYSTSTPCTLTDAPTYAFWVKKSLSVGGDIVDFVDLVYFFYYPYNRGKEVFDTIFGNHVGDWEHVTVRLMWGYDDHTGWSLQPVQMYISAHDFGGIQEWQAIPEKIDTHPVVYSAWGSHGLWLTPGRNKYDEACHLWCEDLVDWTSQGTNWDTWRKLAAFDYNDLRGLGGSSWPVWMSDDFMDPGICEPSNPACGPIYRWGNLRRGSVFGYYRLEHGPTGPVSKGVWTPGILK